MEFLWYGVALFFLISIVKASTTSKKEIDEHNTKVTLENTLNHAYSTTSISRLRSDLNDLEERYNELVELGVKRYRTRYPSSQSRSGALFLGFERVFSVEEYVIISKYEAILKALNSKLPIKDRKSSSYQSAVRTLEYIYNIHDPSNYIDM